MPFIVSISSQIGPWPHIYYSGWIFNKNYFATVTKLIEGSNAEQELEKSQTQENFESCKELCKEALLNVHKCNIAHGDARPANFIITIDKEDRSRKKAYIIDFGFSILDASECQMKHDFVTFNKHFDKFKYVLTA